MATGKRFYWIKLKDSFMASDTIDYFMAQPDGANYVILYQMLCLKTINTGGRLSRQIGEITIPYDVKKIARDCKWFTVKTVQAALTLYKSVGLIYEDQDGVLAIANYADLVGSETDYASQKNRQRLPNDGNKALPVDKGGDNGVDSNVDIGVDNVHANVHTEIRERDKEIDIRERDEEKEIRKRDKEKEIKGLTAPEVAVCRTEDVRRVLEAWNSLGLNTVRKIVADTDRDKWLRKRVKDYGTDDVLAAIEKVRKSKFLMGDNRNGWQATFDWFIRPNNFAKVLSGNYDDKDLQKRGDSNGEHQGTIGKKWDVQLDVE